MIALPRKVRSAETVDDIIDAAVSLYGAIACTNDFREWTLGLQY